MEEKDDKNDDDERQIEFGTLSEQQDEAYHDKRLDADNDLEKGRIKFPQDKLYGRDKELRELCQIYNLIHSSSGDARSRIVFLGGCSGTGKSTLIKEFIRTSSCKSYGALIRGKFGQIRACDPFSAIKQALNQYVSQLIADSSIGELRRLKDRLAAFDISLGSDDMIVLKDTLMPSLEALLEKASSGIIMTKEVPPLSHCDSMGHDLSAVTFALRSFLDALATGTRPMVFFVDDMQWADDAALQILKGVLQSDLKHIVFIATYRSNEVGEEHDFSKVMKELVESKGTEYISHMEICNLSPDSIVQFIADSIDRTPEEVTPIAEAIYTKTLGNIFFVKQALEELVRRNALYYDVMRFQWQFGDVSRVELEEFLGDDVIVMVQSKVKTLPEPLPKALALAAYTRNNIGLDLLAALLAAEGIEIAPIAVEKTVDKAYQEGLVLRDGSMGGFKFAHDRIREAACELVPVGDVRDQTLLRLSMVLIDRGSPGENDWMLFAAALHMNSIPANLTNSLRVSKLNLLVGKIAMSKGAFNEAVVFLRAGDERLDPVSCWKEHYDLTLDLKNNLMETEHFLGNEDTALEMGDSIMENAKSLIDKTRAHYTYIQSTCCKNDNNYDVSIEMGLKILKLYGIHLPESPTDRQVQRSKLRLKIELRGRSLLCCSKFPMATDKFYMAQYKIAQIVSGHAFFAKRFNFAVVLANRLLRLTLAKKSITNELPYMVVCLGAPCRQKEMYDEAVHYANIGINLMDRFPGEKSLEFLKAKLAMFSILSCLRLPFRDAIETFLDLYKALLTKGETDLSLASGMLAMFCFYHASLPLNWLLEPKLLLFEEIASSSGRKTFVVIFSLLRQCLYNLQGISKSSSNPTELQGEAFQEDVVLTQFEGGSLKMTKRDIAVVRLMLAVIFDDAAAMEEMLDRLDGYPVHDLPLKRQHFRMSYTGFASLILSRKSDNKHQKWADTCMKFFEKLARFGSPDAQPVFACMKALRTCSVAAFEDAITVCGNAGLLNLAALMNERCGLVLLEESQENGDCARHSEYFKCAIWLYHDWGAAAKVAQLQSRYEFLQSAISEKPPSQLSSLRQKTVLLGLNRRYSVPSENNPVSATDFHVRAL